jgi:UDP-N-acetylglucosamine 2-epimerase
MSDVFFSELGMTYPFANLDVGSGSHAAQTGAMMLGLERLLVEAKPDVVLVYGDTNSTLAAAVVAAKANIPLAHVEAGLRSGNRLMPEEINRIVTDRLSSILFTATNAAIKNLEDEGLSDRVQVVGDVMFDCVRLYRERASPLAALLARLGVPHSRYVLATIHRAENTDDFDRLSEIFIGLSHIAKSISVILPIHPRTASAVRNRLAPSLLEGISVIEPAGFLDMMTLEAHAALIVTDSGGVQKEAYFHGVPCVTIRNETEWVETVEAGWNVLSAADANTIATNAAAMLSFDRNTTRPLFYGDGHAADRIVATLAAPY